jgi:hypothetical protein
MDQYLPWLGHKVLKMANDWTLVALVEPTSFKWPVVMVQKQSGS